MRVIAVANQKGGCAKTTTSINLAACLAFLNKKILLIDLDPQGHSTCGLGIKSQNLSATIYDVLTPRNQDQVDLTQTLQMVKPNFFVAPCYEILANLEDDLANTEKKDRRLKTVLQGLCKDGESFDFVILDCPPNLGILTYNALIAADEIIIPIEPSFFSLHGLAKISETVASVNRRRETPLEVHALLTIFDSRTSFAKEIYEEVRSHFKDQLFKSIIHESVVFKEAAASGQSVADYDSDSGAFRDYFNLAVEYLEREWDRRLPEKRLGWNRVIGHHYGPRRVIGGVLFQALSRNAREVEIAGDFNHWVPETLIRRSDEGLWQKVIPMPNGQYRYKFIVDGEWQIDPCQPVQKINAYGTMDSCLEIANE